MVKGVNKQIIEINDTGNKYFERVLLFVAPGKSDLPDGFLKEKARDFIAEFTGDGAPVLSLRESVKRKKKRRKKLALIAAGVVVVAAVFLIFNIL